MSDKKLLKCYSNNLPSGIIITNDGIISGTVFGELTDSINPSLITIEYPDCKTETLEIFWSKLEPFLSFNEYYVNYDINTDITEFSVLPSDYNFDVDRSKLSYKYDVIPDGITFTSDGKVYGKIEMLPNNGSEFSTNLTISYPNLPDSFTKIIWVNNDSVTDNDNTIDDNLIPIE